ncbi:TetR family transcriptional regulator [Bacillus glycinifermentans]|uniref:TetR family transcriptional regulator n=1 Tax=Bacillus glycinifermentans TaxID=1664069 RepID=A0A0J6EES9_9BACI|nr:TetR/AcrR family transcriptional regulator [Bacillus glycinifermentans]ATH91904.1 TetR/AcrR family transcriptional regulator [Bacillus glycinifermentans]KMM55910.1 TetR family transcriptional regulator [Bacillus glycinifermentans]KRT92868.1 TetR family transcriptional regulator [Bacillus glycinifermentans]MEC0486238.1 TetR/AcrR family transcriptional regulator [Bacillus glycinifermentans]MEC0494952.1 TetR/AcrR family transcriptional regulator [Bacillus glycinifermentans]
MSNHQHVDRRIKRTSRFLRDAFIELLKEKDVNSITVQEIADRADLTRATFYLHYKNKQHFISQSMEDMLNELIERVKPDLSESDTMYPPPSFLSLFEFIQEHADYFEVMLSDRGLPQFRSSLLKIVQKRIYGELLSSIAESEERLTVPKDILISYITSAHIGVISTWLKSGMKFSPVYMAEQLTRLTMLGPIKVAGLENKIKIPFVK